MSVSLSILKFMQWSAAVSQSFGGEKRGQALQLLSGATGLIGMIYGLQVLMVERAAMPICSAELLTAVGEQSFLRQQQLTVEVAGAVVQPGVWQLAVGARVAEAIEKAGGFSQRADRTFAAQGINLARLIEDGEQLYVPFTGEQTISADQQTTEQQTAVVLGAQTTAVSINTASVEELDTLPGIGAARAADIVENRPYTTLDELVSGAGLTEALFKDLESLITL